MRLQKINSLLLCLGWPLLVSATTVIEDLQALTSSDFAGRKAGSETPNLAAHYIHGRMATLGLTPQWQHFRYRVGFSEDKYGHNVLGHLPCNQTSCTQALVISAHYDHLGGTNTRFYPGANDNASGVAALLALAQKLADQPRHRDVWFLASDAEEAGLHGAYHFLQTYQGPPLGLNINLDMLAVGANNTLYLLSSKETELQHFLPQLKHIPLKVRHTHSSRHLGRMTKDERVDWLKASDHYAFYRNDIAFIYVGMGNDSKHHTVQDDFASVDQSRYLAAVEVVKVLTAHFVGSSRVGSLPSTTN
ncbi:M28 family peptidase [Pseudoalteromonas fenneropenaei]|uniref:M28 family peptidase n=1 Tax=Pseudoalteromonas fenneropenaei TaxID=1737459 RepID=A0ABV7CI32_9GAMM